MQICSISYNINSCAATYSFVAKTVTRVLVNSRFDYANAVLYGTSKHNLVTLQRAQNALARVITFTKHLYHIRPILQKLQKLPISKRIDFKAAVAYKVRQTVYPALFRPGQDVKLHPHRVMSRAWRYTSSTFSLSLVAFCTDVSWGRPLSVSSYTVVFVYESWSYLI